MGSGQWAAGMRGRGRLAAGTRKLFKKTIAALMAALPGGVEVC